MRLEPESAAESVLDAGGLTSALVRPIPEAVDDLPPGARLGDVTIIRFVAEGGMGRVYEGLQGMPCRTVAVKVIRPGLFSAAAIRRFEHEAHVLGRLTHPGIARIFSVGRRQVPGGESPYLVIEFIEDARSITADAAARQLSSRDRVRLFRDACQAVAHGHQRGIIHRDLKPGNILVDATGQVKIIDFGVARSTDADVALTTMHTDVGQLIGTIQYMSPEQFAGDTHDIDVRADVYALGVVLFELLVDRLPYDVARRPVYDVARVVREVPPASLSTMDRRLRGDLDTIVAKCLEKEPRARYSSAAELEADLGRWLRGEPILATPPRLWDAVVRLARRHRLAALATTGILLALLLGGVGISIFAVQAARERAVAVREQTRADAEAETSRQRLYIANLRSLQASLGNRNQRSAHQLYAENLTIVGTTPPLEMRILGSQLDESAAVIRFSNRTVRDVAYSPAGDRLSVESVNRQVSVEEQTGINRILQELPTAFRLVRSGEVAWYAVEPNWRYAPARTSADSSAAGGAAGEEAAAGGIVVATSLDKRLRAVHGSDGRVRIVERATGREGAVVEGHRGRLKGVAFSAAGDRLLIAAPTGGVRMWDTGSGRLVCNLTNPDGQSRGDSGRDSVLRYEFSPAGGRLALVESEGGQNGWLGVRLVATADGRQLLVHQRTKRLAVSGGAILNFSPDGSRLVAVLYDEVQVWDAETGASLGRAEVKAASVTATAFSPAGDRIAVGLSNGGLQLWDLQTFASERDFMGHDDAILAVAFHPDGMALASGSNDGTVRIWPLDSTEPLAVMPGSQGMTAAAFSPDGGILAVAARDQAAVTLWNPRSVERLQTLVCPAATVGEIAFSPDGSMVAAALKVAARDGAVPAGEVRVWTTATGAPVATFGGHARGAERVAFSPDGSRLFVTSGDVEVSLWALPEATRCFTLAATPRVRFFPDVGGLFGLDGSRIISPLPRLVDAVSGLEVTTLPSFGNMSCMAVSRDGRRVVFGTASGSLHLYDIAAGQHITTLVGHTGAIRAAVFTPSGDQLVTGALDGTARLWDIEAAPATPHERQQFLGHEGSVEAVLLTPDGRRLVTSATDGTVRVWDIASGRELCVVAGQTDCPRAVALSPDGGLLVTAATGGPVRIHGLSNADVATARQHAAGAATQAARDSGR